MDGMDIAYRRDVLDALRADIDYERKTIPLTRETLRLVAERQAVSTAGNITDLAQFVARNPLMLHMTARPFPADRDLTIGAVLRRDARRFIVQECADIVDAIHVSQFKGRRWMLMTSFADMSLALFENRPDLAGNFPVEAARDRLAEFELIDWPDRDGMTNLLRGIAVQLEAILRDSGENPFLRGDSTHTVFEAIWDMLDLDERDHGAFYGALRDEAAELHSAPAPR
jgi:hypothetical protein